MTVTELLKDLRICASRSSCFGCTYYNLEDYQIGEQSYKEGLSYENWKLNYLQPTFQNIYKYLIPGGYFSGSELI